MELLHLINATAAVPIPRHRIGSDRAGIAAHRDTTATECQILTPNIAGHGLLIMAILLRTAMVAHINLPEDLTDRAPDPDPDIRKTRIDPRMTLHAGRGVIRKIQRTLDVRDGAIVVHGHPRGG